MAVLLSNMRSKGFTLFELIIAMAILSILAGGAIPSVSGLIESNAKKKATMDLLRSVNYARNHAITHKSSVSICPSRDNTGCSDNWSDPLIIFDDVNEDGKPDKNKVIAQRDASWGNTKLVWRGALGENRFITYRHNGSIKFAGRFAFCSFKKSNKTKWQQIIISNTGRARIAKIYEYKPYCAEN